MPATRKTPSRSAKPAETAALKKKRWETVRRYVRKDMGCCAILTARQLIADSPDHGPAWFDLAIELYAHARYVEALTALRKAEKLCRPEKIHLVYYHYGHLYDQKGAFHLAEKWYRRAVEKRSEDATAFIFLGGLLARMGRLKEAEAVHREATACPQGCIDEAYLNLVLRAQERYEEARDCFRRTLEIDPKDRDARRQLKDVEQAMKLQREIPKT